MDIYEERIVERWGKDNQKKVRRNDNNIYRIKYYCGLVMIAVSIAGFLFFVGYLIRIYK